MQQYNRKDKISSCKYPCIKHEKQPGIPAYYEISFISRCSDYCLLIPVINEGNRIIEELKRSKIAGVCKLVDIIICDGDSSDGSMETQRLKNLGVNTLLVKHDIGKQGSQIRMGISFALERGYRGIITIDGNNKDSIESVPMLVGALKCGYGLVQGSRFANGGIAVNTPISRMFAVRFIHAPIISLSSGFHYTDTTNAFRGYSAEFLCDPRVAPLRDEFKGYELLAYLSIRAPQLGYKVCEVPVARVYPKTGKTPTKISPIKGNTELLRALFRAARGSFNPREVDDEKVR